ncbi:MFS transporter, YNFM family, putative membrane transport protein [Filimonas lacunae]|uniref:MFS transporter, YNFM family, putative membrane transport protein n=1 Tax=Filimonas lacunae TaxID=477680 RepID=A0A173MHL9_9BACT|nr:MFS transporter [Filimonas lacunae]BAV07095.1 major facilitator superfamily MFS_1 [Filimonas lacunae]SIS95062.1 MFS transporter, YNFM family, putative membrane transport protein [Filimonas lacunae]
MITQSLAHTISIVPKRRKAEAKTLRYTYINTSIFLSGLSVFAQLYVFQPLLPLVCKQFSVTPAQSSYTVSASTLGVGIGLFILSFKADELHRKQLMGFSMIISALLTISTAFVHNFPLLVFINACKGIALAGVTGVALAYLSEEISAAAIGRAISLYLSGNAIGGMAGRIEATLLAGWLNWRWAMGLIGLSSLVIGIVFVKLLPASRHFVPAKAGFKVKWQQIGQFSRHPVMLRYYITAACIMGTFVSVYNYLGFRLEAPPFSLPHYIIASVFLMYTIGVVGTMVAGKWSDKVAPQQLIRLFILFLAGGLLAMLSGNLVVLVCGLGLVTFSFFAGHTMASRIIAQTAQHNKSTATALYWLFYYIGSSIIGSGSGVLLSGQGWTVFILLLLAIALLLQLLVYPRKPTA